jgi:hypothetical protein
LPFYCGAFESLVEQATGRERAVQAPPVAALDAFLAGLDAFRRLRSRS